MAFSFLFRTDVHVADRSPASWKGDYPAEIWSNLQQIGDLARKYKVTAVLDGGDYFHIKAATRNPHSIVIRSAELHAGYPCPVWSIEGNHDIAYNNLTTIDRQPLGVLYASGVFKHLREEVFSDSETQVRIVGMPYSPVRTLEELQAIKKQDGDDWLIAIVHALASKDPPASVADFFGEPVFKYSDLVFDNGPDIWCFGHWHRDQGIEVIDGRRFINQGAVCRGSLIRENIERTPKVTLIEFERERVEGGDTKHIVTTSSIELDVLPASEVFDFERKERQEQEGRSIEQFVEQLNVEANIDPSVGIEDVIAGLDFAREVRDLAMDYLERARSEG